MKTMKSRSQESWSPGRYLDKELSEHKAEVLTIKPQHFVTPNLHNAIKTKQNTDDMHHKYVPYAHPNKLKLKACTLQLYLCTQLISIHTDSYHRDLCLVPWNSCDFLVGKLAQN